MFKKILKYTLSIILACSLLCGCSNQTTQAQVGKNLDKKLSNLYKTVKNLDTIDNNYINNPDLQISETGTKIVKNVSKTSRLSIGNNEIIKTIKFDNETESNQIIQDLLKKEIERRISLNNNGICNSCNEQYKCDENGYCQNCGNAILCDENGNCSYCKEVLSLNDTNTCENCNNSYLVNKTNNIEPTNSDIIEDSTITDIDDKEYSIVQLGEYDENTTDEALLDDTPSIENYQDNSSNTSDDEYTSNYNGSTMDQTNIAPDIKLYYYTNDSFSPVKLKYNPRFVNQYDESNINEQLSNYLYKVQRLYAMTEDALEANNILNTTKQELLDLIIELRELNENITNGTCTATVQQLQALTNYTYDLKNTIKNLKNCNGDLENEVSNINSNIPATISSSVDVMNSNYVKLINLIDTRITYHKSAISTLDQIKYLLEDAILNSSINDSEVSEIIEKLTTIEQDSVSENDKKIEEETEDNTSEYVINIVKDENAKNYASSNTENEVKNTSNNDNNNDSIVEISETNANNPSSKKSYKNIDTYKPPTKKDTEYTDLDNNHVKYNIAENNNEAQNSSQSYNNNVANNNQIYDNNNGVYDNNYNIADTNNSIINEEIYKNSVINQNNLNNNDGYGGYYYANDGQIHNNGINNNNEYGNNGNTIENNLNRNNNTNTYGYNTILDIINQGTVNNGINTL